jgi:hypothetical protein
MSQEQTCLFLSDPSLYNAMKRSWRIDTGGSGHAEYQQVRVALASLIVRMSQKFPQRRYTITRPYFFSSRKSDIV